jgi:hypothetical protein
MPGGGDGAACRAASLDEGQEVTRLNIAAPRHDQQIRENALSPPSVVGAGALSTEPAGAIQQRDGGTRGATVQSVIARPFSSESAGGTPATTCLGGVGDTAGEGDPRRTLSPPLLQSGVSHAKGPHAD